MTGSRRLTAALLVACAVTATVPAASAATAQSGRRHHAAAPRTVLVPLTDRRGPAPRVTYYDRRSHRVHDGTRSIRVAFPGLVTQVAEVRGGYVLVNQRDDAEARTTFRFVNRLGRSRVVGHGWFAYLTAVSADGSRIAFSTGGARRTSVVRVADGRTTSRLFPRGGEVVALGRIRALVTVGSHTVWWTPRTDRVGHYSGDGAYAADLSARRVALLRGSTSETYVGSFPRGSRHRWVLPAAERVGRFAEDDRRVLTLGHRRDQRTSHSYTLLRLRSTQRGKLLRTFAGRLDPVQDPRWENASTFLALVRARHDRGGQVREAWLRCRLTGRCERVSMVFTLDRASNQQSPLVLALQRTG
ncbi:hypothetical protein BH10ACT10_BH10ACT10_17740 [soil metagenome]